MEGKQNPKPVLFQQIDYDNFLEQTIRRIVMTKYHPDNLAMTTYWDNVQHGVSKQNTQDRAYMISVIVHISYPAVGPLVLLTG